jgi:D-xylonolactonase
MMEALVTGYGLIEGPTWWNGHGLLFSDVTNGGVYLLDPNNEVTCVLKHRKGIGGIVLHEQNGLVVGGRNLSYKSFECDRSFVLLDTDITADAVGFNDFTTDIAGRIYVGSLAFKVFGGQDPKSGHLHMIDLDGSVYTLSDGVILTNGLGFSPDSKKLYHSDARDGLVRVYDVLEDGKLSLWKPFVLIENGHADGLAVGEDGSVWIAIAHGSRVDVFEPNGYLRDTLSIPLPMVTSVCFGGADLKDLYVVTGSRGGPEENCGTIYRIRVDVPGVSIPVAKVNLVL